MCEMRQQNRTVQIAVAPQHTVKPVISDPGISGTSDIRLHNKITHRQTRSLSPTRRPVGWWWEKGEKGMVALILPTTNCCNDLVETVVVAVVSAFECALGCVVVME
ncbi:hypothetical protein J6590_018902 [Homalodisca vitripennis]|nr:hypothetical protein J6590_018902 [Homalodisca vitripennis]